MPLTKELKFKLETEGNSNVTIALSDDDKPYIRIEQDNDAVHVNIEDVPDLKAALDELIASAAGE